MEYLALEIFDLPTDGNKNPTTSQFAALDEDASISITDTSEIFGSGEIWSHHFTLNMEANAHIFGTAGDLHGSRLHEQVNNRRARLWVYGIPVYFGYLKLGSEEEIGTDGDLDVTIESGKNTFENMIEGAKANQVPMMDDVQIGMALWRKRWTCIEMGMMATAKDSNGVNHRGQVTHAVHEGVVPGDVYPRVIPFSQDGELEPVQSYPRMVFPRGVFKNYTSEETETVDCINTDEPYAEDENGNPVNPFCNVALCYQRQGYPKIDDNGEIDYTAEPEAERGYEVMPADRLNSAPNFFVIYWLRCLMKHLGIHVAENQLLEVEDLRRLFFVNTNCEYEEPERLRTPPIDFRYGKYTFLDEVDGQGNEKIVRLVPEQFSPIYTDNDDEPHTTFYQVLKKLVDLSDKDSSGLKALSYDVKAPTYNWAGIPEWARKSYIENTPTIESLQLEITDVWGMTAAVKDNYYEERNSLLHKAYASSKCFPDVDISEAISALESGFGMRLLFDNNFQSVRIILLRNVFRSREVQEIVCEIEDADVKIENNKRGFRMTYGNSEDTYYYYKGFADMLPHKKEIWKEESDGFDYSKWDLNAAYSDVIHKVSAFNKTCYVTPNTGNAFIVKVDKDAKRYEDLHPALFGCAEFMDAEDGDCTGDEETIEEISVGFTPAIMNDVNAEEERNNKSDKQSFALFVDAKMRPRRADLGDGQDYNDPEAYYDVEGKLYDAKGTFDNMKSDGVVKPGEFAIVSDMHVAKTGLKTEVHGYVWGDYGAIPVGGDEEEPVAVDVTWEISDISIDGHIYEGYRLYLQDNFEPNDDGVSPIESHDWGLTLGIMRGSGNDKSVEYNPDPDDEENETWDIKPGTSVTAHPDTCDSYGNMWAYENTEQYVQAQAAILYGTLFQNANALLSDVETFGVEIFTLKNNVGVEHSVLMTTPFPVGNPTYEQRFRGYINYLSAHTDAEILQLDAVGYLGFQNTIVELNSSYERRDTCRELIRLAQGQVSSITIDGDVDSKSGRFSLKLRAEKPNPYFDPNQPETHYNPEHPEQNTNPRYLTITDPDLRQRGLCDQFYKEYSYWVRNARIVKRTVRMELAQLLAIDKTKRVRVGDITGFIRKIQYTVSNSSGLGAVTMEIMYI